MPPAELRVGQISALNVADASKGFPYLLSWVTLVVLDAWLMIADGMAGWVGDLGSGTHFLRAIEQIGQTGRGIQCPPGFAT